MFSLSSRLFPDWVGDFSAFGKMQRSALTHRPPSFPSLDEFGIERENVLFALIEYGTCVARSMCWDLKCQHRFHFRMN